MTSAQEKITTPRLSIVEKFMGLFKTKNIVEEYKKNFDVAKAAAYIEKYNGIK